MNNSMMISLVIPTFSLEAEMHLKKISCPMFHPLRPTGL